MCCRHLDSCEYHMQDVEHWVIGSRIMCVQTVRHAAARKCGKRRLKCPRVRQCARQKWRVLIGCFAGACLLPLAATGFLALTAPAVFASFAVLLICATCLRVALKEEPTHGPCQALASAAHGIEVWVRHPFTLRICVLKMLPSEPLRAATAKLFGNALPERSQIIVDGRIIPASAKVCHLSSSCVLSVAV